MSDEKGGTGAPESNHDPEILEKNLQKVSELTDRMVNALGKQKGHHSGLDAPDHNLYTKAAAAYFAEAMSNPARLMEAQVSFWAQSVRNWSDAQSVSPENPAPKTKDRRFASDHWHTNPMFNLLRQQYQLTADTLDSITADLTHLPSKERDKVNFFTKQIMDFMSPTNFLATNPDALEKAYETNGESLVKGMENFVADLERNSKGHAVTLADPDAFEVGKDIATTEGAVVFQNRMFQLIQYKPTTEKTYKTPLLFSPPWVNKFYILDLRPENSMIKYAVDQGHTVFVISWVNPDASYADAGFDTYLEEGLLAAIDKVLEITGEKSLNAVGYCIGGTLLTCALAYLTATDQADKVNSATFFTTLTDFSEPGELGAFLERGFMEGIRDEVAKTGYLDGYFMARTFSYLRSRDLIYQPAVRSYMLGEAPPAFDLLQWNSDNTNLPGRMAIEYLEKLYLENQLAEGEFELLGKKIRLAEINIPIFAISTILDHIAPWKSTFKGLSRTRGQRTFVLSESGHVAGVVNPASRNKYGFWHNPEPPRDPDFWFENAEFTKESWWNTWNGWLTGGKEPTLKARKYGSKTHKVIEPAPGSYVQVKAHALVE